MIFGINILSKNCRWYEYLREKLQEINFDNDNNDINLFDDLEEESKLDKNFFSSFLNEDLNLPEMNFDNLPKILEYLNVIKNLLQIF